MSVCFIKNHEGHTPQELLTFRDVLNATYVIRCFSTRCWEELQVWTQYSFPHISRFQNS